MEESKADSRLNESLSALMDGRANELELERILSKIGDDAALRRRWTRFNMQRPGQTAGLSSLAGIDISGRVAESLRAPALSAKNRGGLREVLRPVAGFAVAASVTLAGVLGGQQLWLVAAGMDDSSNSPAMADTAAPVGLVNSVGAMPVRASYGNNTAVPMLQPATRTAYSELARQRMQTYFNEHAEHAALNSPLGLVPYARVSGSAE